jgi:hypothetical protein
MVYGSELKNIHVSSCGRFLNGHHTFFESLRVIDIIRHTKRGKEMPPTDTTDTSNEVQQDSRVATLSNSENNPAARAVYSTNILTMHAPNGVPEFRTLDSYPDGAMVRKLLTADKEVDDTLLYQARNRDKSTSAAVVPNLDMKSDKVRIVLTNRSQVWYMRNALSNREFPSVVTRSERNIRQYVTPSSARQIVST